MDAENDWLTQEIAMNEASQAVKQIGHLAAPGADGMHAFFIINVGIMTGKLIYNMIRAFLHRCHLLKELSNTYITLIPKEKTISR